MIRDFNAALRALGKVRAPSSLAPSVYARIGSADAYVRMPTAIGDVYVAYGSGGVASIRRAKDDSAYERWHNRTFGRPAQRQRKAHGSLLDTVRRQLAGDRKVSVKVDLRGVSPFARDVLEKAREIPRGEVRPYSWIAREIGRPNAVRAVGSALAHNPVPLVIPCHRVVRTDGSVGQYIFGSTAKRALLVSEGALPHG